MDNEGFKQVEYSIPESPGVYRYFDKNEALLYVGKATQPHSLDGSPDPSN